MCSKIRCTEENMDDINSSANWRSLQNLKGNNHGYFLFPMNTASFLKASILSLVAGFASLIFFVAFASILTYNLQVVSWDTASLIVKISVAFIVVGLGALYVRVQRRRVQKPATTIKKLTRDSMVALFSGLLLTFLFFPLYRLADQRKYGRSVNARSG